MEQLFYNGDIITMEQQDDAPEAVLVADGIIKAVGTYAEVAAQKGADCVETDLQGKTLMPAFIDCHGHFSMTIQYTGVASLADAKNFDDIVQLLSDFKARKNLSDNAFIMGVGYDHNFLAEGTYPDKKVLDRVSTTNPIFISHASGHVGVMNSAALALVGYDETTPDVEGGLIARYPGTREPNGYLEEMAMMKLHSLQQEMKFDMDFNEAQNIYLSRGVTTVQDGASSADVVKMLRGLAGSGQMKVDVVAYPMMGEGCAQVIEDNADCYRTYVNGFKIGGYKMLLDGSPQGRTAWMTKPYEVVSQGDDPAYCGYPWMPTEVSRANIHQAISEGKQLLCHCNGDAAADELLTLYSEALAQIDRPDKNDLRPVMIHCQTVREDQLDKMVDLKMIPSIFVAHVNYWGDIHLKNFGQERGSRVSPVASALKRGLVYNFHTDTPVTPPSMFHSVWTAANRITRFGVQSGPEFCISVYDALKAVTSQAAYEYFEEDSKGSIKVGKRADLIIVDQNPLKIDPMAVKDIQVLETYKDGKQVYSK